MSCPPGPESITEIFAESWPRLVATLVRDLGDVELAEDCVAEAFAAASVSWPTQGMPFQPAGWLLTVARRRGVDQVRRSARFKELLPRIGATDQRLVASTYGGSEGSEAVPSVAYELDDQLRDDQLRLILGCAHPALAHDAQVALTLRIVAGLTTAQIARAFFVSEQTMTRRLTRAKTKIAAAGIPFTRSDRETLTQRLPAVSAVIYSVFTEGHTSANAPTLMRGDLCDEAIWLAGLLHDLVPQDPEVGGLYALLLLIDSRRATRVDEYGAPVLLADQDRAQWDQQMITRGLAALSQAHRSSELGPYQCQAAIAALHATATTFGDTDWDAITLLYDVLDADYPGPLVTLNRAIALSYARSPRTGLNALDNSQGARRGRDLEGYVYFHSTRAELLARCGRVDEAIEEFGKARQHSRNDVEGRHLQERARRVASGTE
ncbi:MAG: DUF6596 domain-containing protein [Ornithinimicrobium sp.]